MSSAICGWITLLGQKPPFCRLIPFWIVGTTIRALWCRVDEGRRRVTLKFSSRPWKRPHYCLKLLFGNFWCAHLLCLKQYGTVIFLKKLVLFWSQKSIPFGMIYQSECTGTEECYCQENDLSLRRSGSRSEKNTWLVPLIWNEISGKAKIDRDPSTKNVLLCRILRTAHSFAPCSSYFTGLWKNFM